jgi:hypothetical protein
MTDYAKDHSDRVRRSDHRKTIVFEGFGKVVRRMPVGGLQKSALSDQTLSG